LEEIQNLDRRVATPSFDRINGNVIQLFNAVMRIGGTKDLEFDSVSLDDIQKTIEASSVKLDTVPRRTNEAGGLLIHQFHWMVQAGIMCNMEAKNKNYHSTLVRCGGHFPLVIWV
jgi:hypothetical protein